LISKCGTPSVSDRVNQRVSPPLFDLTTTTLESLRDDAQIAAGDHADEGQREGGKGKAALAMGLK